jgi:hypothetical protein
MLASNPMIIAEDYACCVIIPMAPALERFQDLPAGDRTLLAGECPSLGECLAWLPDPRNPRDCAVLMAHPAARAQF